MRLRALFRRLAVPAVAGSLAFAGLATPAQAEEIPEFDVPLVGILSPETVTVINGQSKTVKFDLFNIGGGAAKNVVLDFGTVAPDMGLTAPAGCTGTVCALGDFKPGEQRTIKFTLKPSGAAPAKVLNLSTTVDGVESDAVSITVVRTDKGGADLEMGDIKDLKLGLGGSADVPVVIANTGNEPVEHLGVMVIPVFGGIRADLNYRNCVTDAEFGGLLCVFDEPLAGGGTFTLPEKTPLRVSVPKDTGGPFDYPVFVAAVGLTDKYVAEFATLTKGTKGAELKLETLAKASAEEEPEAVEDLNPDDNITDFSVSVPKTSADSAAVGGTFRGAIGDTSTVKVGVRNLGPTATVPPMADEIPYVHVRLPRGVELTDLDERCLAGTSPDDVSFAEGGRDFICLDFQGLGKGRTSLFSFTVEITEGEHDSGRVTVDGGVQDSKSGNDKAALDVELTGGGSGGGLPITGAPAGLVAGGGAALLIAGFLAYRMARRRRIVTVVE
ncbi:hypothetical protein OHA21_40660 [Actinoplanes sp. NBC_00393]|uniref:hypothetical protein n=1 Tax=Actinoplanes sp. NBC_00393 TaxID=2975953 RepID=UPI002E2288E0